MAEYKQEHLGEFVYDTYEQEGPIPVHLVWPAKERIVRCRDCASATECEDGTLDCHGPLVQTWDYWNDEPLRNPVPPDGFCAWGNRREADE